MNAKSKTPTDSFGNEKVYVEKYGGWLPASENVPTTEPWQGVSGISYNGDVYCIECAKDQDIIEIIDNEIMALVDGERVKPRNAPKTDVVLPSHETDIQDHCGFHENCLNAVEGSDHPYNPDCKVGIGIEQHVLQH